MASERRSPALLWFLAFANCAAVIGVCMRWVDRPVADRVQLFMMRQLPVFDGVARVLGSLHIVVVTAVLILLWWSVQALRRRPLGAWSVTPLQCASAVVGALAVTIWLKMLIGRSQVYPLWIERREYGFNPFHGVHGYGAFPSATMAAAGAFAAVIWIRAPRLRLAGVLAAVLVALGIILTNGHWVSDVIGGAFLGAFAGWGTVRRIVPPAIPPADPAR